MRYGSRIIAVDTITSDRETPSLVLWEIVEELCEDVLPT